MKFIKEWIRNTVIYTLASITIFILLKLIQPIVATMIVTSLPSAILAGLCGVVIVYLMMGLIVTIIGRLI